MNEPHGAYEVKYPFVLDDYEYFDGEGMVKSKTWKPGIRFEAVAPDDSESVADGEGVMVLTVVSVHKPGRFPSRVFYTRRWRDPKGVEFGKGKLHISTIEKFRRLSNSYQYPYRLIDGVK